MRSQAERRLHEFAADIGKLVAFGQGTIAGGDEWIERVLQLDLGLPHRDWNNPDYVRAISGTLTRLRWTMRQAASELERDLDRAAYDIERGAWTAMDKLTPSAAILAESNARRGSLSEGEVRAIVADVAARWLKQRRYRHG